MKAVRRLRPFRTGFLLGGFLLLCGTEALWSQDSPPPKPPAYPLPLSVTFKGEKKFQEITAKALKENWRALPMGERVVAFGKELRGTPYKGFTLEIDDHIESPSVNLEALDCWSFFEISLGLARMIETEKAAYTPQDLLDQILTTRYRGGLCTGDYLERIHYLAEWYFDNDARGTINNATREIGPTKRVIGRKVQEMTVLWKSYRYLRENPSLRPKMKTLEQRIAALPVNYIPKASVKGIEAKLQNGDVIGIVTNQHGGFCSHVGLAIRTEDGVLRFMHASTNHRKVVIDESLSTYLNRFKYHAGILVGRPLAPAETVTDGEAYQRRLKELIASEAAAN